MNIISVISICSRQGDSTYRARAAGMGITASCTGDEKTAVERVAEKVAAKLGLAKGAYVLTRFGRSLTWTMSDVPAPASAECPLFPNIAESSPYRGAPAAPTTAPARSRATQSVTRSRSDTNGRAPTLADRMRDAAELLSPICNRRAS